MGTYVLVVDDEPMIRTFMRCALEEEGYRVALARDGRQALDFVGRDRPDAIVLDLAMPGLDGAGFARELARLPGLDAIPMLVVSAAYSAERAAAELGAAGCLAKPFDLEDFLAAVARLAPAGAGAVGAIATPVG